MTDIQFRYTGYHILFDDGFVNINVDSYSYVNLESWKIDGKHYESGPFDFSNRKHGIRYEAYKAMWAKLEDEDLVELVAIGPEDSEYFLTENFKEQLDGKNAKT